MAAVARYLADTSALGRLSHPAVAAALSPHIEAGNVAVCGMIELEILLPARSPDDYARRQRQLHDGFESLSMPERCGVERCMCRHSSPLIVRIVAQRCRTC